MKAQNVKRLPQVYLDFLKTMGKNFTGAKYPGENKVYESLLEMQTKISKYFPEFTIPEGAFIFANYSLDSVLYYFMTDNHSDNPPIYFYQYEGEVKQIDQSLTTYFKRVISVNIDSAQEQHGKNTEHFGEKLYHLYQQRKSFGKPCRCTPDEILALMDDQGVKRLPKTYHQILEYIGKNEDIFQYLTPSDGITYQALFETKDLFLSKFQHYEQQLLKDIFICYEHHNYDYQFFYTDNDDDDPAVYGCFEGAFQPSKIADSVSQYFLRLA